MKSHILLFSDHVNSPSGLARITRDLALRIHSHLYEDFEVATLGAGHRNPSLPFPQFNWTPNDYYLPFELPMIQREWAQGEPIILLTIHDIQRMLPIADPTFCPDDNLAHWISANRANGKLKLWGYFPIDAHNKDGKLGNQLAHTLTHYDRILVPSKWAKSIVERTLPGITVDAIPHGIDCDVFKPYPHKESQDKIGELFSPVLQWPKQPMEVSEDAMWVGICATNTSRKDWAFGIEVVAELAKKRNVFLWAHTDALKRDHGWSILELLSAFNLLGCSMVTVGNVPDAAMAVAYSALDIFLGIGRGEGFGYPPAEAMACGTPVMTTSYGAQSDYVPYIMQVEPTSLRIEGPLNLVRPIHSAKEWAAACIEWEGQRYDYSILPKEIAWPQVWPTFSNWLKEGV